MAKAMEKTNVMRLLDAADVVYRGHSYDPTDGRIDGVSVAEKVGFPPEQVFKTLLTQGASGAYYVFVLPVAAELDLKKAARAAGEKNIVMAPARDLLKLTGYVHGGCSPIGMKKRFPTFVDETAQLFDTIHFSGGKVGCQIRMNPDDLGRLIPFQYADLTV